MAGSFVEAAERGNIEARDSPNDLYYFCNLMIICNLLSVKKSQLVSELHLNFIYIQTYKQRVKRFLAAGANPNSEQNEVSFIQYLSYNCIFVVVDQMRVIFAW